MLGARSWIIRPGHDRPPKPGAPKPGPAARRRSGVRAARRALLALVLAVPLFAPELFGAETPRDQAVAAVEKIRHADYAGDQAALQLQFDALSPLITRPELTSRVHYWRGFAQWRRAINGFNDGVDPAELDRDLNLAVAEFRASAAADTTFADARVGEVSALGYLMYLHMDDRSRMMEVVGMLTPLLKATRAAAPDNPRLIWVMGPVLWQRPAEQGGGPAAAMKNYERGLEIIRGGGGVSPDPLDPSWGEPELLMNMAWSELNAPEPDPDAAERHAKEALNLVPGWHYVRDILMDQIGKAKSGRH